MSQEKAVKVATSQDQIKPVLDWVYTCLQRGLAGGPVEVRVSRADEARSADQNAKQWAMYSDLSEQLQWHGMTLSKEQFKDLLSHDWSSQIIVPAISGGFCALGIKTSKLKKREMAELIELTYAFGAEHGVKWSEAAQECYDSYREAQL